MPAPAPHIFGIRHHGPGSARSLLRALEALQPDAILVEGPPEGDSLLPLLTHEHMRPPVALLVYVPDEPQRAVFYPFARFSPEWQALHYGISNGVAVRFMDLPQAHLLADSPDTEQAQQEAEDALDAETVIAHTDPLRWLAEASGYDDSERWWEHMIEQRRDSTDLFAAILEAMTALRDDLPPRHDPREAQREATMRQNIRKAQREGHQRIAVVCGAWHAPALASLPPAAHDTALLKGLPKAKVRATWVPWTYGRLSFASGYGAGITSPGWYEHLWTAGDQVVIRWLSKVAHLLREHDLDASSAHIIEAVRLAETLAALRERPLPGLPELTEAVQAILCYGNDEPLRLIQQQLIVGEVLGEVPPETPMVPLQQDVQRQQKRLKLPPSAVETERTLDVRSPTDLERSHLLHRLALLDIPWGRHEQLHGKSGTFHERWRLQWQPEFEVSLIEKSIWGTTVEEAATAYTHHLAQQTPDLPALTTLVGRALLANLPDGIDALVAHMQARAALTSDVGHLMHALPPLAHTLRYRDVRQTHVGSVAQVVDGLVVRICIGLPGACAALNDEAAAEMDTRLTATNDALRLLNQQAHQSLWHSVLHKLCEQQGVHGLLVGRCCRILLESGTFDHDEVARRMSLAFSSASEPAQAAAWLEGFLSGSGTILLLDDALWGLLDGWLADLRGDTFNEVLPLLRRTFATFPAAERRKMGQRARQGSSTPAAPGSETGGSAALDEARAAQVLPVVAQLLGLNDDTD